MLGRGALSAYLPIPVTQLDAAGPVANKVVAVVVVVGRLGRLPVRLGNSHMNSPGLNLRGGKSNTYLLDVGHMRASVVKHRLPLFQEAQLFIPVGNDLQRSAGQHTHIHL